MTKYKGPTLSELQDILPWTIHYHHDFRASEIKHKDFQHAAIHVGKALGKIFDFIDQAEHKGFNWDNGETENYVADLVICALRMAKTIPNSYKGFDLMLAVMERIESKNGVSIEHDLASDRWFVREPSKEVKASSLIINDSELGDLPR